MPGDARADRAKNFIGDRAGPFSNVGGGNPVGALGADEDGFVADGSGSAWEGSAPGKSSDRAGRPYEWDCSS